MFKVSCLKFIGLCSVFAAWGLFSNTNFFYKTTPCYDFIFAAHFVSSALTHEDVG
jgi:hypothetical protein